MTVPQDRHHHAPGKPLASRRQATDDTIPVPVCFSGEALRVARQCALKIHLSREDAEDCAACFAHHILCDDSEARLRPPGQRHLLGTYCPVWLRRCALNHALNFRRHLDSVAAHETAWPAFQDAASDIVLCDWPDDGPGPEQILLRQATWRTVQVHLAAIAPQPRTFFVRHCDGESASAIAVSAGRTTNAVEQSLTRTRRRLRTLLARDGITEANLVFVFAPAPLPGAVKDAHGFVA